VTEIDMLRSQIPETWVNVKKAMIEYKKCQNKNQLHLKNDHLKELFRQIERFLELETKFSSKRKI